MVEGLDEEHFPSDRQYLCSVVRGDDVCLTCSAALDSAATHSPAGTVLFRHRQREDLPVFHRRPFCTPASSIYAFNMLTLWMLGPSLEQAVGRGRYVALSILSPRFRLELCLAHRRPRRS